MNFDVDVDVNFDLTPSPFHPHGKPHLSGGGGTQILVILVIRGEIIPV